MAHRPVSNVIKSQVLQDEWRARELNRRNFIRNAALAAGALGAGCAAPADDDDDTPAPFVPALVGLGGGDSYGTAVWNALQETVARDNLTDLVGEGDTVYLKVNSNSGNVYPYSTRPRLVEIVGQWALERGASKVIVGDRSFWGDGNTYGNLVANGIVDATASLGDKAELVVLDGDDIGWVDIAEDDAPDWAGGFRFPQPVVEADVIINLPIVKTHFISTFTMGMKNIIGLVNAVDRERPGNLYQHVTSGNKLYRQIAQLNQHITPTLTILDGWQAVVRGGPTIFDGPGGEEDAPGWIIASTDRLAADAVGLALLKQYAWDDEEVHDTGVWDNPQIAEAVAAGVGVSSLSASDLRGDTVSGLQAVLDALGA
jgi:uncharacterized protein (DUF362 family)